MKNRLVAGLFAAAVATAIFVMPAQARCEDGGFCTSLHKKAKATKKVSAKAGVHKTHRKKTYASRKARKPGRYQVAASSRQGGHVVALIKSMAPAYGVPTWFALRIAKVESNYNPSARGSAGELGVYQLKCATAKGIGYRGSCSGLLNASTNVQYGLKHLALAMKASGGNLRLTASKHNGGLGRKKIVHGYVAKVF